MAVAMMNAVLWDIKTKFVPHWKHITSRLQSCSMLRLLVTANVVLTSPIHVTLMMEAVRSSERQFLQEPHCVTQSVALSGWGVSDVQGRYLHTGQHKHRYPCLNWYTNPCPQYTSDHTAIVICNINS
jgi:esterase/lipase superfamily enzyme